VSFKIKLKKVLMLTFKKTLDSQMVCYLKNTPLLKKPAKWYYLISFITNCSSLPFSFFTLLTFIVSMEFVEYLNKIGFYGMG
jgi:hypothetical protein